MQHAEEKAHEPVRARLAIRICQSESVKSAPHALTIKIQPNNFHAARHEKPCRMQAHSHKTSSHTMTDQKFKPLCQASVKNAEHTPKHIPANKGGNSA